MFAILHSSLHSTLLNQGLYPTTVSAAGLLIFNDPQRCLATCLNCMNRNQQLCQFTPLDYAAHDSNVVILHMYVFNCTTSLFAPSEVFLWSLPDILVWPHLFSTAAQQFAWGTTRFRRKKLQLCTRQAHMCHTVCCLYWLEFLSELAVMVSMNAAPGLAELCQQGCC